VFVQDERESIRQTFLSCLVDLEWPDMTENALLSSSSSSSSSTTTNDSNVATSHEKTSIGSSPMSNVFNNFDDETKTRILTLLKELGESDASSQSDHLSTTKLAFIGKNLYVCSTCTGPVQWV
jgi:hypothetical protein